MSQERWLRPRFPAIRWFLPEFPHDGRRQRVRKTVPLPEIRAERHDRRRTSGLSAPVYESEERLRLILRTDVIEKSTRLPPKQQRGDFLYTKKLPITWGVPGRLVHPGYYEKIYLCVMKTLRHDQDFIISFRRQLQYSNQLWIKYEQAVKNMWK